MPEIHDAPTMEELQAMLERADKAIPGPWVTDGGSIDQLAPHPAGTRLLSGGNFWGDDDFSYLTPEDCDFIAHARTDLPRVVHCLLALLEEQSE